MTDPGPDGAGPRPRAVPTPDGPLEVCGDLTIAVPGERDPVRTDRTWFCRCGHSANKPFCDGSHRRVGFRGGGLRRLPVRATDEPGQEVGALRVRPRENGSLFLEGWVHLETEDGEAGWIENVSMCRCGLSENRPLCDSSHKGSDFAAPGAE